MSVINEVLNQLEQRGVNVSARQEMVRPVPAQPNKQKNRLALLLLALLTIVSMGLWYVRQNNQPAIVMPDKKVVPAGLNASVTPAVDAASGVAKQPDEKPPVADLQMSFELANVPLPSSLRASKEQHQTQSGSKSKAAPASTQKQSLPTIASPKLTELRVQLPTSVVAIPEISQPAPAGDSTLPIKQVSPTQQADAEFRKGVALMQQGRVTDAMDRYQAALKLDEKHATARHALIALLLENKRGDEAEQVLREGLRISPEQYKFSILLARLEVERNAVPEALATLQKYLPYAGQQADYQAFLAALLQRQDQHKEAVVHYQLALRGVPNNGIWLIGYAISLQALQRNADAQAAFKRALETNTLSPELQALVQQKLKAF